MKIIWPTLRGALLAERGRSEWAVDELDNAHGAAACPSRPLAEIARGIFEQYANAVSPAAIAGSLTTTEAIGP